MSRTRMLRAAIAWAGFLLGLSTALGGCGQSLPGTAAGSATTRAADSAAVAVPETTSSTYPALPSGQTYEAVILGPAAEPLASEDIAPRLFRDEPSVREVLETALPASFAKREGQFVDHGTHLIVVLDVGGATESPTGVDVYAEAWVQWFALAGWQPVQDTGGSYPVRIRLQKDGDGFRLERVDIPKDGEGYISSLRAMLPDWVRDRVTRQESLNQTRDALVTAAAAWARPNVPADLFVEQVPATIADPHRHEPPSSQYRMLASRYVDCVLAKIATPSSDDYQPEFGVVSADGRFRLFMLPSYRAVEDRQTGEWWSIVTPAHGLLSMAPAVFDPVWRGHTLFIDFATTVMDPLHPTLTHYEIDFDTMTVVRAVPMGPLSFNEPRPD